MQKGLTLILFLFTLQNFSAQAVPVRDTISTISVRTISKNKMEKWKRSKDFQYDRGENISFWWDRLKVKFFQWLRSFFSNENNENKFWTGTIIVCVIIIGFAIYKLSGMSKSALFERKVAECSAYKEGEENIHEIDFSQEIKNAEGAGNLRLAVRYRYLQVLKFLSDKGLINWKANKTNHAYVAEMKGQPAFAEITYNFEYVWYGEREIDKREYEEIKIKFEQQQKDKIN